jgi:hypothetical protein
MNNNYESAVTRILKVNESDPSKVEVNGEEFAANMLYSQYMGEWQEKLYPEVAEEVKLAARAQHICRWELLRNEFPEGRAGYLKWRQTLAQKHAEILAAIMADNHYSPESIERASLAVSKKNLKTNPDSQVVEDCACLVFLEYYFDDFITKHTGDKLINIVQKTWGKMSERAHEAALKLSFSDDALAVIQEALKA